MVSARRQEFLGTGVARPHSSDINAGRVCSGKEPRQLREYDEAKALEEAGAFPLSLNVYLKNWDGPSQKLFPFLL